MVTCWAVLEHERVTNWSRAFDHGATVLQPEVPACQSAGRSRPGRDPATSRPAGRPLSR